MMRLFKFRSNDLNPSNGKQVEFSARIIQDFFHFSDTEVSVVFIYKGLTHNELYNHEITSTLKLSPERGDYKIYQNTNNTQCLKDFLLESLGLTQEENTDDFFALEYVESKKFNFYYIPSSSTASQFFSCLKDRNFEKNLNQETNNELKLDVQKCPELFPYLAAIRTKPFLLLAGISGTGKSRLVRQLAKATAGALRGNDKPGNFELIPVRPNWHDSTELLGYVSRISGHPEYVMTDFVRFLFKAMLYPKIPFFLCLDEMNLAPVEQYFAEYLSVIETRKKAKNDMPITTDVLVRFDEKIYQDSVRKKLEDCYQSAFGSAEGFEDVSKTIVADGGLRIPSNLVVIGTVNMDETTFSFSRKVLDRAMSFELNVVDMNAGIQEDNSFLPAIPADAIFQTYLNANDVFKKNARLVNAVIARLEVINKALDKTPFKIAYRSRNEVMIYVYERLRNYLADEQPDEETLNGSGPFHQAMDEAISMKILSRIEGDEQRISRDFLNDLENAIKSGVVLSAPENSGTSGTLHELYPVCSEKIKQMQEQLKHGYVSFWS